VSADDSRVTDRCAVEQGVRQDDSKWPAARSSNEAGQGDPTLSDVEHASPHAAGDNPDSLAKPLPPNARLSGRRAPRVAKSKRGARRPAPAVG